MKEGWSDFQMEALMASLFYRALTVALLVARLQIERVALDFFDDVLLQNLALEAPERVLKGFTVVNVDLGQISPLMANDWKLHPNSFPLESDISGSWRRGPGAAVCRTSETFRPASCGSQT